MFYVLKNVSVNRPQAACIGHGPNLIQLVGTNERNKSADLSSVEKVGGVKNLDGDDLVRSVMSHMMLCLVLSSLVLPASSLEEFSVTRFGYF